MTTVAPRLPPPQVVRPRYPGEFLGLLARDHLALFRRMAAAGDVTQIRLGRERLVLLNHPDDIKQLLVGEQRAFVKGRALDRVKTLLGNGLLTNEGEAHLRQRRLVQPAFHRERIAGYGAVMAEYAERLSRRWQRGAVLDVHEAISLSLKLYRFTVLPGGELIERLPIPVVRRAQAARARLDAWLYDTIRQRRADGVDRGDLLSMLLRAQDDQGHTGGMTDQQVRDEVVTLFVAGHETTAVALSWTWYLLSAHPAVQVKLHAELEEVLGGRPPAVADVPKLIYTRQVFAEAMRLYPPAWILERRAVRDVQMRGHLIPAGSLVFATQYNVHRDARWYPNPEQFDPERWRPELVVDRPKFSYFPFGAGTRVCIGEQFAWMEGVLVLATIAQRWRLVHDPTHEVAFEPLVTSRPKFGMRMRVVHR